MAATVIGRSSGLRFINAALLVLAGSAVVAGACNFSRAPQIDRSTLWVDTVRQGELVIERRGTGQLIESDNEGLYAQIRVPESQSLDLEVGQTAVVDLRIAEVPARVAELGDRIMQGTRLVRLEFTGEVPEQALPGMSIDADIQVDVVPDALFVGKPAYTQAGTRVGLFKVVDGGFAQRVEVQTGRSSVNLIQITDGLEEGDQVILSDMSRWDAFSRVALR